MIRMLLHIYPKQWRAEYGEELEALLKERPLRASTVADVLWNALRQRVRYAAPGAFCAVLLCVITAGFHVATSIRPAWTPSLYAWCQYFPGLIVPLAAAWTILRGETVLDAVWAAFYTAVPSGLLTLLFCCGVALGWIHPAPFCDPRLAACGMATFFFIGSQAPLYAQVGALAAGVLLNVVIGALLGTLGGCAAGLFKKV